MKRKIILSFLAVFLILIMGAGFVTVYVNNITSTLSRVINLHQIEGLRHQLIISIQEVQSDLHNINSSTDRDLDKIVDDFAKLELGAQGCSSCHHTPDITRQIMDVQGLVKQYQNALSYYITASANDEQIRELKFEAAGIGNNLLVKTEAMAKPASLKLKYLTDNVMKELKNASLILISTMLFALVLSIIVAVRLTGSIVRPVDALLEATRVISSGNLGYKMDYHDNTEFGELASHFNVMSESLLNGYTKLENEIAERKNTESALVKSESFLNNIFDSIQDPFCIIDRAHHIVRANEAYVQMKQMPLHQLLGHKCNELPNDNQTSCVECIVENTFATGLPCSTERLLVLPDGLNLWKSIHTYPIVDEYGVVTHVIEYSRDITERKSSEEALRESEERYALAALGSNDGLWDWNLRNNSIYFSSRWKSMLGYDEEEIGTSCDEWFSRVHPDDRSEMETRIAEHLSGQNSHYEDEFRIRHRDGTYRWVLSRGLTIRDAAGHACRMAGSQTDISLKKSAADQLEYNAFHDTLTGLPNRALFMDRLQHVIDVSNRRDEILYAVLFMDLDRFKIINDSLGHLVGDQLLVTVGRKLTECLRPGDTVARLGGDEFCVLLENIGELKDAVDVCERIHRELSQKFMIDGNEVYASASIGIALGSERYKRAEHVLRDADIAMYQAKGQGNASSEIFDSKMHADLLERIQLESDLHAAVDHNEFVLHYQPIVDLSSHRLSGFEALVRWNHPAKGLISPSEFIPLAEDTGLINKIGEWIIREACRELKALQERYPSSPPLKMSINISGRQFAQESLSDLVAKALQETELAPHSVAIEITESMLMENIDLAIGTMNRLRNMGVHIHIDDFGTGYSSLSYLHRLPMNALKIDRSFIKELSVNGDNQEIILSIVSLAKSLNLDVIAEGVELDYQLHQVKELNCRFGQGFLFAKPLEPEELDEWVRADRKKHGDS